MEGRLSLWGSHRNKGFVVVRREIRFSPLASDNSHPPGTTYPGSWNYVFSIIAVRLLRKQAFSIPKWRAVVGVRICPVCIDTIESSTHIDNSLVSGDKSHIVRTCQPIPKRRTKVIAH